MAKRFYTTSVQNSFANVFILHVTAAYLQRTFNMHMLKHLQKPIATFSQMFYAKTFWKIYIFIRHEGSK